jgi:NAD(P)-dependent dehydrogenase (short-subunit alcohol dehydrogenase family)
MSQRVWSITGASAGFGRAIAEAALLGDDTVIAAVRRPDSVADLAEAHPDRVTVLQLDVTDRPRIRPAIAEALARHGRVDVLVNNAGKGVVAAAEDITEQDLRDLMDLHFFGPVELTRAVLPSMRAAGSGAIVQLSSQGGRFAFPGTSAYSGTKFALEGWSEAFAQEVASFGIKVLIVEPGPFRTSFNQPHVLEVPSGSGAYDQVVGPIQAALAEADGQQAGDPARAARAIITALEAENTPLRLPLGNEAANNVRGALDRAGAELAEWEALCRSTDFPA